MKQPNVQNGVSYEFVSSSLNIENVSFGMQNYGDSTIAAKDSMDHDPAVSEKPSGYLPYFHLGNWEDIIEQADYNCCNMAVLLSSASVSFHISSLDEISIGGVSGELVSTSDFDLDVNWGGLSNYNVENESVLTHVEVSKTTAVMSLSATESAEQAVKSSDHDKVEFASLSRDVKVTDTLPASTQTIATDAPNVRFVELAGYVDDADRHVTERHFGGNVLYTRNTENGVPDPNLLEATENLNINYHRYPAGQPDVAYADGVIVDGYLPDHLISYLESARANNFQVLIVTPTHDAYTTAADIGQFAYLLTRDYSDVVHAFEVGNEYWNHQTETSYGIVANDSVLEIAAALKETGNDKPIWVQMGDAGGWESEFHARNDDRGWITRTVEANETILKQLSAEARAEIDGVVEHFYLRGGDVKIEVADANDQMISLDFAIWSTVLGNNPTLNITEWNVRSTNLDQLGIRAASSIVAHFSHIVDLGADEAYLWPPHLNTSSDLAGSGDVLLDPVTGIVVNSVGGAIFSMMSSNLPGTEYLPSGHTSANGDILPIVYASDDKVVVYVSSRTEDVETVGYSLGAYFTNAMLVSAIRVGYDPASSDGRHFNYKTRSWDQSTEIMVRGQSYVINEHDVRASIEVLDHGEKFGPDNFVFELLPYEVVQLVYTIPDYQLIRGTENEDVLAGTGEDDLVHMYQGNDSISAGNGDDTVHGGGGDDYINSGNGDDSVDAGQGNDSLRGWGGDDTLFGNEGDDDLQGSFGRDSLLGGSGNDTLSGGDWHDTLQGGEGSDLLMGDNGNDSIVSGRGQDSVNGGNGRDTLSFEEAVENVSVWSREGIAETGSAQVWFTDIEIISATSFNDRFVLEVDNLDVFGLGGSDTFEIWSGSNNTVYAGSGQDISFVYGGVNNRVHGGAGNDTFYVFDGANSFYGGAGHDQFILANSGSASIYYQSGDGHDTIHGFQSGIDELHISQDLQNLMKLEENANGTMLSFDGAGSILLNGIHGLSAVDFVDFF